MRRRDRAARRVRRGLGCAALAVLAAMLVVASLAWLRQHPQDSPWAPLDLTQPVGLFTGRKLAALGEDFPRCQALLAEAGVKITALAPVSEGERCGYADGVRFAPDEPRIAPFVPANLGTACPVAAALALWQWHVVQPAAQRHLRMRVTQVEHLGSYNCRRLYGRSSGGYSQHATADAIDVAGFRLADGSRISLLDDWSGQGPRAAFLREVRDGACRLFATVLSPDYNAAHRDHLHLDQAERGRMALGVCR